MSFLDKINKKGFQVNSIYTDNGSEYMGDFDKYLTELGIIHIYGGVNDKRNTSPIERFNRTLRISIEKYKYTYGRVSKSIIPIIIDAYNDSSHSIGFSPNQIITDDKIESKVREKYTEKSEIYKTQDILSGYVRILLPRDIFTKTKPIWSSEIYKIKQYNKVSNRYTIDEHEGLFSRDQLQPIYKEYLMRPHLIFEDDNEKEKSATRSRNGRMLKELGESEILSGRRERVPNRKYEGTFGIPITYIPMYSLDKNPLIGTMQESQNHSCSICGDQ